MGTAEWTSSAVALMTASSTAAISRQPSVTRAWYGSCDPGAGEQDRD